MAKLKLYNLIKKYNISDRPLTDKKYSLIMDEVLNNNSENINRAINRISKTRWEKELLKLQKKHKRFILPEMQEVLPKRSIFIKKTIEHRKLISQTLKDKLTKNLRDMMIEKDYIIRTGINAGKINPKFIKEFQNNIKNTFEEYTKKDPRIGTPTNIRNIAITEVRSAVNEIKKEYVSKMLQKNPDVKTMKKWIHNTSLSRNKKDVRLPHVEIAEEPAIPFNQDFVLNQYNITQRNGVKIYTKIGEVSMSHPHDKKGGAENLVGCHCDWEIYFE
jgi:hypothetical protein